LSKSREIVANYHCAAAQPSSAMVAMSRNTSATAQVRVTRKSKSCDFDNAAFHSIEITSHS